MSDETRGVLSLLLALAVLLLVSSVLAVRAESERDICLRAMRYEVGKSPAEIEEILRREREREGR